MGGMDSHVLRPITTAFLAADPGGTDSVRRLKWAMSEGRRHGFFYMGGGG